MTKTMKTVIVFNIVWGTFARFADALRSLFA